MILPTEVTEGLNSPPSKLALVGHQGGGKTSAVSLLPNCLIIDLQEGAGNVTAMKINVKREAMLSGKSDLAMFKEILLSIRAKNKEIGGFMYDFIAYDTLGNLENFARQIATINFNNSAIGKGMAKTKFEEATKDKNPTALELKKYYLKDVVAELPQGGGYYWLAMAWEELYDMLIGLAKYCTIFLGHTKQGSLKKKGQDIAAKDMDLIGKIKLLLLRDIDASGYVFREGNKFNVSFVTDETDLTTKGRSGLTDKEFTLTEKLPDGTFTHNWEQVFPFLNEPKP